MNFSRIQDAIDECRKHLDSTGAYGTQIESFLVQYLLTLIVAEYEMRVVKILEVRCARIADAHLGNMLRYSVKRNVKKFRIGDINDHLKAFDVTVRDAFSASVANTPAHTAFDNIVNNRQLVAHKTGTNMTFVELSAAFTASQPVVMEIAKALGLTAAEISSL